MKTFRKQIFGSVLVRSAALIGFLAVGAVEPIHTFAAQQTFATQDESASAASLAPMIFAFSCDVQGPVRGGNVIHATLCGTAGERAMFCIRRVAENIPLTEQTPGTYTGSFTVPPLINVKCDQIVGHLVGPIPTAPAARQAPELLTIDNRAPEILDESPANDTTTITSRPEVYALLDDGGGCGIDPNSVKLSIDGNDVTHLATITDSFVNYLPTAPLSFGRHTVQVLASDKLGNQENWTWDFNALQRPKAITSFTCDQGQRPLMLKTNQSIVLTLAAESGGSAFASAGNLSVPLIEQTPGIYRGVLRAVPGTSIVQGEVVAHFTGSNHVDSTASLPQDLTIDAGAPLAPEIITPASGHISANAVQIVGTTSPGAKVNVRIDYATKALGLIAVNGTASQTQVVADETGKWSTDPMGLLPETSTVSNRGTAYTILATTVDAFGRSSCPAVVKLTVQ